MTRERILGTTLALWAVGMVTPAGGQTLYIFVAASQQENIEVQCACNLTYYDHVRGKAELEEVIAKNPKNRLAKALLARLLLKEGRTEQALATIRPLISGDRPWPFAVGVATKVAEATGDRRLASDSYQKLLVAPCQFPIGAPAAKRLDLLAAKAEAEGELGRAEQLLKADRDETLKDSPYLGSWQLGEFYLRHGEYAEALHAFRLAEEQEPAELISGGWNAVLRLNQAKALWALGRHRDAWAKLMQTTERLLSDSPGGSRETLADAVAQAYTLAHGPAGTDQDRKKANDLLQQSAGYMRATQPFSAESLVLVLAGRQSAAEETKKIEKVLEHAPNLDWAIWSALCLGLTHPGNAGHLLDLLPSGSVQATIRDASCHRSSKK